MVAAAGYLKSPGPLLSLIKESMHKKSPLYNSCTVTAERDQFSVNGAQEGMLAASPGAGGTFAGMSGTNSVTVVAKFANGAESVV
jgi:hypothetical protein